MRPDMRFTRYEMSNRFEIHSHLHGQSHIGVCFKPVKQPARNEFLCCDYVLRIVILVMAAVAATKTERACVIGSVLVSNLYSILMIQTQTMSLLVQQRAVQQQMLE